MSFHKDAVKCKMECCVVNIHNASYFSSNTNKREDVEVRQYDVKRLFVFPQHEPQQHLSEDDKST